LHAPSDPLFIGEGSGRPETLGQWAKHGTDSETEDLKSLKTDRKKPRISAPRAATRGSFETGNYGRGSLPKLCPKVILEGTRLTSKTEVAFALNRSPGLVGPRRYEYHSPLISAEWCGFTNQPWGRGLINFDESEERLALDTYRTWVHLLENLKYYSWIVDRFHLSTRVYQRIHRGRDYDFRWLEERLARIGFVLVLLTRAEDSFADARRERLKISGNPSQYDDLGLFLREQREFEALAADSLLPLFRLEVAGKTVEGVTAEIESYLKDTGHLYATY
jgi:hypothetical protein